MALECIKRRLLFACRQTYGAHPPGKVTEVGWSAGTKFITAGAGKIDRVLVGRIEEGVVVAFRGTLAPFSDNAADSIARDWLNNVEFLSRDDERYRPGRVHRGFAESLDGLWDAIEREVARLLPLGEGRTLFVTGHSKGGAMANLFAWRARALEGIAPPVRVFTIAAARAGNEDFRAAFHAHGGIRCLRYEAALDIVPLVPLGADTPMWAKPLIKKVLADLANNNYVGVGTRVPARLTVGETLRAWGTVIRGFAPGKTREQYLEQLAGAHLIGPDSGYDQLICKRDRSEPGCTHD